MKYIVLLGDGMADEPLDVLGGKTPLEYAATPVMDELAGKGEMGMVRTVPAGMKPGSDVANLAVFGYDPKTSYSGRSPLEALSVGVSMAPDDVVFRCNIVTLSEEEPYVEKTIIDHSSGEISTEDADILMNAVRDAFNSDTIQFYTGTSYRHITVWKGGEVLDMEPPHDHLGEKAGAYLPKEALFRDMMEKSFEILNHHPLNEERRAKGLHAANSAWFWGAGKKPALTSFEAQTGKRGIMISAVDLLKEIAVGASMDKVIVEGANGGLHTNYEGKAMAALKALTEDGYDFAYIHVEAPDEMGHQGSMTDKIKAIENIDEKVLKLVVEELEAKKIDFRLLVLPDHPTPIEVRTHTGDPVPYLLYDSTKKACGQEFYNEKTASQTGIYWKDGYQLMGHLLEEEVC